MLEKIKHKIEPKDRFILFFLLKAIGLYILWYFTYDLWLKKVGDFDIWIIDMLVYHTVTILETTTNYMLFVDHHTIGIHGGKMMTRVGRGCNGLELYALFAGFIIIFNGSWRNKL